MAKLIVRENGAERILNLKDEQITIGRASDNLVTLDDSKSSRNHAVIKITKNGAELIDLESSNGTRVGGQLAKQQVLKEGDEIQIGRAVIVFSYTTAPESEAEVAKDEEEEVLEGIDEEDTATRRAMRFRRNLRNRSRTTGRTSMSRTPLPAPAPLPAKPIEPKPADSDRNADTNYDLAKENKPAAKPIVVIPAETKLEPPKPEPAKPAAPAQTDWRNTVKKFYLVDQGKVRLFTREAAANSVAPLPLSSIFSESADAVPWDDVFRLESAAPESGYDGPRAAYLFSVRPVDGQGEGSIILVDSSAVVTVIEQSDDSNPKSTSQFTGRAINLAATVATEWSAESLQKEFDAFCSKNGRLSADYLRARLGKAPGQDFWKKVEGNLQAGRIRLIFIVREPTVAIQKVIDFLHGKTSMAAYAMQLEVYLERGAEKPRTAFSGKILEPSKSARVPKGSGATRSSAEPNPALDVVSM